MKGNSVKNYILGALAGLIVIIACLVLAPHARADEPIDVNGLTAEQIAEIKNRTEEMRAKTPEGQTQATIEKAQTYVEIGRSLGAGIGEAARSMGVAVNDFANTPVGRLATFAILWKVIGYDFIGIIFGVIWFTIMVPLWVYFFRRICLQGEVREFFNNETGKLIERRIEPLDLNDGDVAGYRFVGIIVLAAICLSGCFMIF